MTRGRTVLFVDDEASVLRSIKRGVFEEAYESLFAESGAEALELLETHDVQVLVTDMRMPEMTGLELLRIVQEKHPDIVRIVLSGYTHVTTLLTAINHGHIYKFITKPWQLEDDLKPIIRQALDFYELKAERERFTAETSKG